jgi:hypothetical protein
MGQPAHIRQHADPQQDRHTQFVAIETIPSLSACASAVATQPIASSAAYDNQS